MYTLYSKRIKNASGEPEVYVYDIFPQTFRNQMFYALSDVLDFYENKGGAGAWEALHNNFAREIGVKTLGSYHYTERSNVESYIAKCSDLEFLDLLDYAFALQKKEEKRASEIEDWFVRFENILKKIFEDDTLMLAFDIDSFKFSIVQNNREPFDFNTMSSGYSAVFDIINDLIMRTENRKDTSVEGIVLIDEIETHLHIELQKIILPFLTEMFPNIQFFVTTHSPFILNSIDNAVIYDLENRKLVVDGLANYPYGGIVEGYFNADQLSEDMRGKLNRYGELTTMPELTDEDYAEIVDLEAELDEIPDFLSPDIASEYSRLKLEFSNRG